MSQFNPGKVLKVLPKKGEKVGSSVKIIKHLGGGGQGDVYLVDHNGEKKALKWYKNLGTDPAAFYNNLVRNAEREAPDKAFLWPEAIMENYEGFFGYLMPLRPEGYYDLTDYMLSQVSFDSFTVAVEACIRIVSAFRILHIEGYSYQDLNDGNFFINPKTGDVLICDPDNIAPDKTNTGIIGKLRYMAPEIVCKKAMPSRKTDYFSMAIILFIVLCMNHPLEGKRSLVPCLTNEIAEKLYGSDALFICDPHDNSNAPVKNIHNNVIERWGFLPEYVKDAFIKALSQDAIKDPNRRLRELDWLKVLTRFRSDIVRCSCGSDVFIKNATTTRCDVCGKPMVIDHALELPDYPLTAKNGTHIYRCQLGICNADVALKPVALVVAKKDNPAALGVKNMSDQIWLATTTLGTTRQVPPGEIIPFKSGIAVEVYDSKIVFK